MFREIKWLFFDIGSTLIDEGAAYKCRMNEMATAAGVSFETVYETAMGFYRQNRKGDLETAKLLGIQLPKWYSEEERLYPDAAECLRTLHDRYRIGIIANQIPGTKERLAKHGILQYIDLVIASAEEGVAKPDKRIFEIALERSGCRPENAIMIGDRIDNDIVPAKQLGMKTIRIKQGFGQYWSTTSEVEEPDMTIDHLADLSGILL